LFYAFDLHFVAFAAYSVKDRWLVLFAHIESLGYCNCIC